MDTTSLKLFSFVLLLAPLNVAASVFDMGEHSGFIRDSNGNYSHVSSNGTVRSLSGNTQLVVKESPVFQSPKGQFAIGVTRYSPIDTSRVGKAVVKMAKLLGPVGLAIAAADLVCELSSICNNAGSWQMQGTDPMPGQPNSYPGTDGSWTAWGSRTSSSPEIACRDSERIQVNVGDPSLYEYSHMVQLSSDTYQCYAKSKTNAAAVFYASNTSRSTSCATGYTLVSGSCVKQGVSETHVPTQSDWDAAESKLNDPRLVPELDSKGQDIPVGNPQIQTPIEKIIDKKTTTNKDQSGNTTGTTEETTKIKLEDASPAENPTNDPNIIKITESTTVNNYDVNNNITSSSTTINSSETPYPKPEGFTIDFDSSTNTDLEKYSVPSTFTFTSWGSGQCPADRSVSYHYGTLNLTFQPACDFAVAMQPAILAVAGFLAMFIIAGVRNND